MVFESSFEVAGHTIGPAGAPFVIAEMSGNHNGSLDRALAIVDAAVLGGATALKIQTYTADTLTIDVNLPAFRVDDDHDLWAGRNLYQLYDEAHTPWEWHEADLRPCPPGGLVPFSAPFDPTAVGFLETLGVELYKIASAEIVDLPLIREIARTGKPLIISTGMASLSEVEAALGAVGDAGGRRVALLACTAAYPAAPREARLANIGLLKSTFGVPVGLSDHTLGIGVSVAATALGADIIEKHVTLARDDGGVDAAFSLTPDELAALTREVANAREAVVAPPQLGPTEGEQSVLRLRRSLYVVADVDAGDEVTAANVRSIRPAGGLEPDEFSRVEGRRFRRAVQKGEPLSWDLLS